MIGSPFDAVVIGAGVNGLVAAAVLGRGHRRVLVVDSNDSIGGQARPFEFAPGFRAPLSIDGGWLSPRLADDLGLTIPPMVEPATSLSIADDDGCLSLPRDPRAAASAISTLSSRDAQRWPGFVARLGKLAGFLGTLYEQAPPDVDTTSLSDLASLVGVGRKFRSLGREDMTALLRVMPMSIQDLLDDVFENTTLKAAIAAGALRDLRQGPRSGGTTFNLLHYLVGAPAGSVRARAWWRDHPTALAHAVEALVRSFGGIVRTNTSVERIIVKDYGVAGVLLSDGEEVSASTVISTADPASTLLGLVDPVWLDPDVLLATRNIKYRGSTALVYFALDRLPNGPGLDVAALSSVVTLTTCMDRLERAYDSAKYGDVSAEPHVEFTVPSLRWPSLAPQGKHVIAARMQFVPNNPVSGAWTPERTRELGDIATKMIERAVPGFSERVVHRAVFTPADIEARFGLTDGALTHGELTLDQILFMRPIAGWGRHAMPIDGLYLGGSGAHPGPGIVGTPGWLAGRAAVSSRSK